MKTKQNIEPRICPCDLSEFCGKRSDEEILEFVKVDKECYAILIERYEAKLTRYIKRISGMTKESIEDILQSVFLKTYVNINSFDGANKFSTWIYRIAHNETVNYWRKSAKSNAMISLDENEFLKNTVADTRNIEEETVRKLDGLRVSAALEKLQEKQRRAIDLRYNRQLSYQEIAERLKKPIGTIGTLINRGKKVLREELQKTGFSHGLSA